MQVARAEAQELEERLAWVNGLVDEGESRFDTLSGELAQVQREIDRSELHVEALQSRFDSVIRQTFMDGGTTPLSVMFEEDDTDTMQQKMLFLSELALHQVRLAEQTTAARESLEAQTLVTSGLIGEQRELLGDIRVSRADLIEQSEELQAALAGTEAAQMEVLDLVSHLKGMLSMSDFQQLQASFKGEDSVPYGQWAQLLLAKLDAPQCEDNLIAVVAWQLNEGTDARWNPLATTYSMPGASSFNWVGVRDYTSLAQGLTASVATIKLDYYVDVVRSLRACAPAEDTAAAIAASPWCGCGAGYVTALIDNVRDNLDSYSKI